MTEDNDDNTLDTIDESSTNSTRKERKAKDIKRQSSLENNPADRYCSLDSSTGSTDGKNDTTPTDTEEYNSDGDSLFTDIMQQENQECANTPHKLEANSGADDYNNDQENVNSSKAPSASSSLIANKKIYDKYSKDCYKKTIKTAVDALTSIENIDSQSAVSNHSSIKDSVHSYLNKTKSSVKRQHHKEIKKRLKASSTPMNNLPSVLEDSSINHDNIMNNDIVMENLNNQNNFPSTRSQTSQSSRAVSRAFSSGNTSYFNSASQFYVQTANSSVHMNRMVQSLNDVMISGNCTVKETARSSWRYRFEVNQE